jgi:flagellar biosynthesis/type III secretory pathway protein FliH
MQPEVKAKYMKHLKEFNISEHTLESTWLEGKHEGLAEGMEKGMEKGMERGSRLQLESTVKRLFNYGMEPATIAQIQEIAQTEVEDILSSEGLL